MLPFARANKMSGKSSVSASDDMENLIFTGNHEDKAIKT